MAHIALADNVIWDGNWGYTFVSSSGTTIGASIVDYSGSQTEVTVPSSVTYEYYDDKGNKCWKELTVLKVGKLQDKTFAKLTLPESVVSIDGYAFWGCKQMKDIHLPESLVTIGDGAFYECNVLGKIAMPSKVTSLPYCVFSRCNALTNVVLNNVTSIGKRAFDACNTLPEIDVSSVTNIADEAFLGCSSLKTFEFPDCIKIIPAYVMSACSSLESVSFANDITDIYGGAFQNCSSLKSIVIPTTVTNIGDKAFNWAKEPMDVYITDLAHWCSGITLDDNPLVNGHLYLNGVLVTNLVIPAGVKFISPCAFSGVKDFESITLPEGLERLEDKPYQATGVFGNCQAVTNIVIPSTLRYCGRGAFYDCGAWASSVSVQINDLANYCTIDFADNQSTPVNHGNARLVLNGEEVNDMVVPSCTYQISNYAFRNCRRLTSVTFEGAMYNIGYQSFETCNSMTSVTFRASVDTIGAGAFAGANKVRAVNYPDVQSWCHINFGNGASNPLYENCNNSELFVDGELVTDIDVTGGVGQYAFNYYRRLKSAKISGVGVVGNEAFRNCSALQSVEIGDGVGRIEYRAFRETGISLLRMDRGVTNLNVEAFDGCYGLRRVSVPPAVTALKDAFGCGWNPLPYTYITDIEIVPDEIETTSGLQATIAISNQFLTGCSSLKTVSIPKCIGSLEADVFAYEKCPALRTVYVAEGCSDLLLADIRNALSSRTDVDLVFYGDNDLPYLLPDATAEQIAAALGEFADPNVTNKVTTWSEYMDFRQWVSTVKDEFGNFVGGVGVRASPYAWLSYALASETLLVKAIVENDLRVSEFVQETNSVNMSFNMAVTINGVTVGATAKPAHLTEIFGVKGDEELDLSQFDEEDLATTFSSPAQGMLNLNTTVNKDADSYFMKMKVR